MYLHIMLTQLSYKMHIKKALQKAVETKHRLIVRIFKFLFQSAVRLK